MHSLTLLGGDLNIPLSILTGCSYTKAGNIVETSKNKFYCKGYACREVAVSFSLTPPALAHFNECNDGRWLRFPDLVAYFMQLVPDKVQPPYALYIAGHAICPELKFTITSATNTLQSDRLGNVQRCDVALTLSGCACAKAAAQQGLASYDSNLEMPKTTISCKGKTCVCQDEIAISEMQITPTTLRLRLLLSDSFKEKSANAWVFQPAQDSTSVIAVDGYGSFYIKSVSTDEDSVVYECSIFSKTAEQAITQTVLDGNLATVLGKLRIEHSVEDAALNTVDVSNYTLNGSSVEVLKELQENLGFLIGWRDGKAHIFEVPKVITANGELNYFITEDIASAPTTRMVYRDALHEYRAGNQEGQEIIINSPVCTSTDRAPNLLSFYQLMESAITLTVPNNKGIKHMAQVTLNYNGGAINCLVTDYTADLITNTMQLQLSYIKR